MVRIEYNYCLNNETRIFQKAKSIYAIGCNKNHRFNHLCCDFKLLEQKYRDYE